MQGDHAPKYVRNQHVVMEEPPELWLLILLLPTIFFVGWWTISTLFSGDPMWLINFLFK